MTLNPKYTFVHDDSSLKQLLYHLQFYDIAAVDTEADPMYHYEIKLCLIQITIGETHWLVDTLAGLDLSPIFTSKAMKHIILHGADYDLRLLWKNFKYSPVSVFDTMLAAKFLGEKKLGLADLVYKYFQEVLEKDKQKSDWTLRPLPAEMCRYAMNDTVFLHELCALLGEQLLQKNRFHWLKEMGAYLLQVTQIPSPEKKEPWRIIGSHRLSAKSLNLLKHLWYWREKEAKKLDRPSYKVLAPGFMLNLVKRITPHQDFDPSILPKLPKNFTGKRLESFYNTLRTAFSVKKESYPSPYKHPPPPELLPEVKLLDQLKTIRNQKAESLQIDPSIIANRPQLIALATRPPFSWEERFSQAHLMNFQIDLWQKILNENELL